MTLRDDTSIKTYDMGEGYRVDVIELPEEYEAWIYEVTNGIKELMFGCPKDQQSYEEFLDMVEANFDDYQETYVEKFVDGYEDANASQRFVLLEAYDRGNSEAFREFESLDEALLKAFETVSDYSLKYERLAIIRTPHSLRDTGFKGIYEYEYDEDYIVREFPVDIDERKDLIEKLNNMFSS